MYWPPYFVRFFLCTATHFFFVTWHIVFLDTLRFLTLVFLNTLRFLTLVFLNTLGFWRQRFVYLFFLETVFFLFHFFFLESFYFELFLEDIIFVWFLALYFFFFFFVFSRQLICENTSITCIYMRWNNRQILVRVFFAYTAKHIFVSLYLKTKFWTSFFSRDVVFLCFTAFFFFGQFLSVF